jgi:hypothetical protein
MNCAWCGNGCETNEFTRKGVKKCRPTTLHFCSQDCLDEHDDNPPDEDYYCGEREVDSDPYD